MMYQLDFGLWDPKPVFYSMHGMEEGRESEEQENDGEDDDDGSSGLVLSAASSL